MRQLKEYEIMFWLHKQYPLTIINDRYCGRHSGGEYLAFPYTFKDLDKRIDGDDTECSEFWEEYEGIVGRGSTVTEALQDLDMQMRKALTL